MSLNGHTLNENWFFMRSNWCHILNWLIEAICLLRPFYIKFMWGLFICWGLFPRKFFLRGLFLRSLFTPTPVIDCLEIQSWLKGKIVPNWMSRLSMAASKMHFWRLSMIKWCKLLYILRMASDHVLGCSWGHTLSIWMKFSENVGMIPIKICYSMQFLFTSTN